MSRKILGIDIRTESVTAVLMETGLKKSVITDFINIPFPDGEDYNERLSLALASISQGMDLKDCTCALTIPSSRFIYRSLTVPFHDAKKIQQMLPFELESVIPFPVENLLFDFSKLPAGEQDEETRIIAAGIEIEQLRSLISTVEACGIFPDIVSPEGYSAANWLCRNGRSQDNKVLIDFDGRDCSLYLTLSGKVSLIRSFSLTLEEAGSAEKLWGHIKRSIAGFESLQEMNVPLSGIFLNGFDDDILAPNLESVSSVPVQILDVTPPPGTEMPDGIADFSPRPCFNSALASALALAEGLKGMNFRRGPLAPRSGLTEYRGSLIKTGVFAAAVIILWLAGTLVENHMAQKKVDELQAQITGVFKETFPDKKSIKNREVHQMRTEIETLKEAAFSSGDTTSQLRFVDILNEISRSIPSATKVHFSKLVSDENDTTITGTTGEFSVPDDIKKRLEKIEGFHSVRITTDKDGDNVRFRLKITTGTKEAS